LGSRPASGRDKARASVKENKRRVPTSGAMAEIADRGASRSNKGRNSNLRGNPYECAR